MAHTFEDLVSMQRAADQAHARVLALRDEYGPPAAAEWTAEQTEAYEQAWQEWRRLAEAVQAAVAEHAQAEEKPRYGVEMDVKRAARHPEPAEA